MNYDHRLMMYSKAERRIYERASGVFFFCWGMWSLDEMYAFTREGRVRIGGLSRFYVFDSICMGIGCEIHFVVEIPDIPMKGAQGRMLIGAGRGILKYKPVF